MAAYGTVAAGDPLAPGTLLGPLHTPSDLPELMCMARRLQDAAAIAKEALAAALVGIAIDTLDYFMNGLWTRAHYPSVPLVTAATAGLATNPPAPSNPAARAGVRSAATHLLTRAPARASGTGLPTCKVERAAE